MVQFLLVEPAMHAIAVASELHRCAAYVSARDALVAVHDASVSWSDAVAHDARGAAIIAVATIAEAVQHPVGTARRGRCIRDALAAAIALVAALDVARAEGADGAEGASDGSMSLADHHAGRAVALLGLLLHANTIVAERK